MHEPAQRGYRIDVEDPTVEDAHVGDFIPDPDNRRAHNPRNLGMLVDSLHHVGAARSIVVDEDGVVLAGNGVLEAAGEAGITRVRVIEADGNTVIAVRRRGLNREQKRALAIYDNRTAELATWDARQLAADDVAGLPLQPFWTDDEIAALKSAAATEEVSFMARANAAGEEDQTPPDGEHSTFSCPLTLDQERAVRAALAMARRLYGVTTTGDALTAALAAWTTDREADEDTPDAPDAPATDQR